LVNAEERAETRKNKDHVALLTKLLAGTGAVLVGAALGIFIIIAGTLGGILVGWIVGWFFSETILGIFAALGIKGFAMWQIGAWIGFVSAFFRYHPKSKE
jgi:hypothetical protein